MAYGQKIKRKQLTLTQARKFLEDGKGYEAPVGVVKSWKGRIVYGKQNVEPYYQVINKNSGLALEGSENKSEAMRKAKVLREQGVDVKIHKQYISKR